MGGDSTKKPRERTTSGGGESWNDIEMKGAENGYYENAPLRGNTEPRSMEERSTAPDGGWGWFVVFGSFMIHVVTDGITYSFGVFYLEFLYYFREGKGTTAWIASILVGVTLCSGPISSMFVNKYGCRAVTIAGSILASVCLLASVWAPSVFVLYATVGVGTGLGFGLIYLPAIVSVTCYFDKYRSLATGIAVCGSGLGTLLFAPFIEYLIVAFGWRGAMMIASGIVLNCIIFGATFRPLEPVETALDLVPVQEITKKDERQPRDGRLLGNENVIDDSTIKNVLDRSRSASNVGNVREHFFSRQDDAAINVAMSQPILVARGCGGGAHARDSIGRSYGRSVMNRRDIFYRNSVDNFHKRSESIFHDDPPARQQISLKSLPIGTTPAAKGSETSLPRPSVIEATGIVRRMLELSLLKDPIFLLFTLSNFCTSIGFNVPYVYLVAQAEERGIRKDASSYLLAIIGIANTAGRIVLGYVSDKAWINRLLVYNACLTICGISTGLSVFCKTFEAFGLYASVFGFTAGAYVGLTSVILVDLFGLDRLTNSFGLLLLFQGFASFLGPPIVGWLYDALNSYDPGFIVAGGMIWASGAILFFIPPMQRWLRKASRSAKMTERADVES